MSRIEELKRSFSKTVEKEVEEWSIIPPDERPMSFAIVVSMGLIILYFGAHQMLSTGFFTASFGIFEMIMLYGSLFAWIVTAALMLAGLKGPSRDFDAFGGLLFAGVSIAWILVVFPFDFALFADVLPVFLRFLMQWISNEVAWVLMMLSIVVNLCFAIYSLVLRVSVRKAHG